MTGTLSPIQVNQWLDDNGFHDDARGPGCYALELLPPADVLADVEWRWSDHFEVNPPDGLVDRLASAERFCYVGSHGQSVYKRLNDHATGFQSSTIMDAWPPVGILDVTPIENPREHEWSMAQEMSDETTACWQDGDWY